MKRNPSEHFVVGVTYETYTEESVANGDAEDRGWESEKEPMELRDALNVLKRYGPYDNIQDDGTHFIAYHADVQTNYRTGEEIAYDVVVEGSPANLKRLLALYRKSYKRNPLDKDGVLRLSGKMVTVPMKESKRLKPATYGYNVNLDERGMFNADVLEDDGHELWTVRTDENERYGAIAEIEDGWMKNARDLNGLAEYLVHLGVIAPGSRILPMTQAERAWGQSKDFGSNPRQRTRKNPGDYNFTVALADGKWRTYVDPVRYYGYFEHDDYGEGGGLWFEKNKKPLRLIDADGTSVLPKAVARALRGVGIIVPKEFDF